MYINTIEIAFFSILGGYRCLNSFKMFDEASGNKNSRQEPKSIVIGKNKKRKIKLPPTTKKLEQQAPNHTIPRASHRVLEEILPRNNHHYHQQYHTKKQECNMMAGVQLTPLSESGLSGRGVAYLAKLRYDHKCLVKKARAQLQQKLAAVS